MSAPAAAIQFAARSDAGRVRTQNEDAVLVQPEFGLAVLADGMGGYNAGEVASKMATALLGNDIGQRWGEIAKVGAGETAVAVIETVLRDELVRANTAIHEAARSQPQYAGMGTTVVVTLFHDNRVTVAHVGDSRLYRLRGEQFEALTRDHSLLQEQIDAGLITQEQARSSNRRNLVTRALGADPEVVVDVATHQVAVGDIYLLCSDGLNDMLEDEQIAETLRLLAANPELAATQLIDQANDHGGRDNVSVILAKVVQDFAQPRSAWQAFWRRVAAWLR